MSGSKALEILTPLDELEPKTRLAVEYFTNPLFGRTFGNKAQSALRAGYEGGYAAKVLHGDAAKRAIGFVMAEKEKDSAVVADFLSRFTMDAARKLVQQVGLGDTLDVHEMPEGLLDRQPEPIIGFDKDGGEKLLGYDDSHLKQAKAITDHNKAVAVLAREQRAALQIILAYHLGTPEQKVMVEHKKGGKDPLDLGSLDDAELRDLARTIQQVRADNKGAPPPEEDEASNVVEAIVLEVEEATPPEVHPAPSPPLHSASQRSDGGQETTSYQDRGLPF